MRRAGRSSDGRPWAGVRSPLHPRSASTAGRHEGQVRERHPEECLLALSAAGLGICWRQNAGKVQTSKGHWIELGPEGIADIVGILPDGRIYFVECKTRTGRQREAQKRWQKAVEALGAIYVVARSGAQAVDRVRAGAVLRSHSQSTSQEII